tara:strand:- start:166 stop:285 length:120 start_codon:yes stop_codon:yes gene_type:complete
MANDWRILSNIPDYLEEKDAKSVFFTTKSLMSILYHANF